MTQQGMRQQGSTPGDRADGASDVTVAEVRFEHHRDSFGIGEAQPRLSWIVDTTTVGWRQTSYEIEAYKSEGQLRDRTGRVESAGGAREPLPAAHDWGRHDRPGSSAGARTALTNRNRPSWHRCHQLDLSWQDASQIR